MASNEIQDLGLAKLPTAFFPAPNVASKNSKPRVVNIAYDQSNFGDAMIAKAIGLGLMNPNDDIRILHIVNQSDYTTLFSPMISANGTSGTHHDFVEENIIGAADDLIWQVINVLKKRGFQNVSSEVIKGDPKDSIVDYCRLSKPAYMITGTRGLGAVKSAVMGSVSKYLINHCPCPVLVIKLESGEIEARKKMTEAKNATFEQVLARFTEKK